MQEWSGINNNRYDTDKLRNSMKGSRSDGHGLQSGLEMPCNCEQANVA